MTSGEDDSIVIPRDRCVMTILTTSQAHMCLLSSLCQDGAPIIANTSFVQAANPEPNVASRWHGICAPLRGARKRNTQNRAVAPAGALLATGPPGRPS